MLSILVRASLEGAVLVTAIWVVSRVLPLLTPAARAMLWWCAAAKFVVTLIWVAPVSLPILPAADARMTQVATVVGQTPLSEAPTAPAGVEARKPTGRSVDWSVGLVAAWALGCLATALIGIRQWRNTVALIKRSTTASSGIQAMTVELASRLRLRRVPVVLMSDDLDTPMVAGLRRSVILLPTVRFAALSNEQQRMALCHELAHLKRHDLWLGCIPALAERVFFFHPLARFAGREYALCRESACDAIVLEALDAQPREYGRLLLDLGVTRRQPGLAAAGAPWSFSNLKRRITMLSEYSNRSFGARSIALTVIGLSMAAIVPLRLAARSPADTATFDNPTQSTAPSLANATLDPRSSPIDPSVWRDLAPREEPGQRTEQDVNFVLFLDDHHTTMSGSTRDIERARRFKRSGERLLWFRRAGREYVIRDPEVLRQVEAIWQPVNEIGDEQGKLGAEQGELGARQGELGAQQGALGAQQGRLGARQGVLGERQARLAAQEMYLVKKAILEKERHEIDADMKELDRQMRALDAKIRELDKPMQELSEQMEPLSKEMEILGAKMEEAQRKADADMRVLLDRAMAAGVAEAVK